MIVLACLVVGAVWVRWPGFREGGFASHDVAGMLYNAMLIHAGGLPYVDDIELKAPGTFYLATVLAGPEGRDIASFQIWANTLAITSLVTVAVLGWRLWGARAGLVAAILYGLHDAHLDSMDANYVTWAQFPQIAAAGLGLEASRRASKRGRVALWFCAGVMAGLAALMKRPSGVVLLLLLVWAFWPGNPLRGRLRDSAAIVAGFLAAHLPLAAHYLARGHLGDLVGGYVLNRWGARYVTSGPDAGSFVAWEAAAATVYFLALPLALAAFAFARGALRDRRLLWLSVWTAATLVAAAVGMRFYKGYFLAVLPPLCLLAASPWGLFGGEWRSRWWLRGLALVPAALLLGRQAQIVDRMRNDRWRPHDSGGQRLAAHVRANTQPGDRIWVWGWHLWDVYPYAGRLSGSRIYKSLGLLTPPNDDTWRRRGSRLQFADGEFARILVEDLRRTGPAYVLLGSTVPHRQFDELRALLRERYVRDRRVRVGRVELWRLRSAPGPARHGPPPQP